MRNYPRQQTESPRQEDLSVTKAQNFNKFQSAHHLYSKEPVEEPNDDTVIEEEIKVDSNKFMNRFNSVRDELICVDYVDDDVIDASAIIDEELDQKEEIAKAELDQQMEFEIPAEFMQK